MHEVVLRRYRKLLELGGPFPDLVSSTRQGAAVRGVCGARGARLANLVAVGIAKKEELLYTGDGRNSDCVAAGDPGLLLIQRIRDEAHRFAVTFHRRARTMRDLGPSSTGAGQSVHAAGRRC